MFLKVNDGNGEIEVVDSEQDNTIKIDNANTDYFVVGHRGINNYFTETELRAYLKSINMDLIVITMYNVSSQFKLGELVIGEHIELRLYTYEYNVSPLIEIFKEYYKNEDKAYKYEYNFYADEDTINQLVYYSYEDLSKVLDGVEEDYIYNIVLRDKNNDILAVIKDFDEKNGLYSLTITGDYNAVEHMIDIFEDFLR